MNANTNAHSRAIIHGAKASNTTLAHRFGVSTKTIAKWKSRDFVKDKTSVSGLRIIDSNAQTGITWWNWTPKVFCGAG
jgi:DNA-binding transcriptional regulator YiaG